MFEQVGQGTGGGRVLAGDGDGADGAGDESADGIADGAELLAGERPISS